MGLLPRHLVTSGFALLVVGLVLMASRGGATGAGAYGSPSLADEATGDRCYSGLYRDGPEPYACSLAFEIDVTLLGPCEAAGGWSRCPLQVDAQWTGATDLPADLMMHISLLHPSPSDTDLVLDGVEVTACVGAGWNGLPDLALGASECPTLCFRESVGTILTCAVDERVDGWTAPNGCNDLLFMASLQIDQRVQRAGFAAWYWLCQDAEGHTFLMRPGPWPF